MKKLLILLILVLFCNSVFGLVNVSTSVVTPVLENTPVTINSTFDSTTVTADFFYNNTLLTPTRTENATHSIFTNSLITPFVNLDTNLSFFWNYSNNFDDNFWNVIPNLISYWSFNFDTVTTNNLTIYDINDSHELTLTDYTFNHGELKNDTVINSTFGINGSGAGFDGVDDYINLTTFDQTTLSKVNNYSISMRFRLDPADTSTGVLFASSVVSTDRMTIAKIDDNLRVAIFKGTWSAKSVDITNKSIWHTVMMVVNGGITTAYLDGVNMTGTNEPNTDAAPNTIIGSQTGGTTGFFNGSIDSIKIWNRSLTLAEILADFNNQTIYTEIGLGLISQYAFENNNDTHTFDENNLVDAQWGEGNNFNGIDNFIRKTQFDLGIANSTFTVSGWLRRLHATGVTAFIDYGSEDTAGFIFSHNPNFRAFIGNGTGAWSCDLTIPTMNLTAGELSHQVYVFNKTHLISYKDGVLNNVSDCVGNIGFDTSLSNLSIGSDRRGGTDFFNGSIDDVLIFNRSLSAQEVAFLFNHTFHANTTIQNQSVFNMEVDNCSTFTFNILNFTYFDQLDLTPITTINAYDLQFEGHIDQTLQGTFSGNLADGFCSSHNLTTFGLNYSATGELTLSKPLYGTQIYEYTAVNPLLTSVKNYQLFLASLANTSTIVFTWRTNTFENVDGIMEIYLCNGDGTRSLVGTSAIINGEAYANLELINTPYSYEVLANGRRFTNNESYTKCHIESQTTRLYILDVGIPTAPITGLYSIPCNITRTGNFSFLMTWGLNPESSSQILGCATAFRQSVRGSTQVFEECSNTSGIAATVADSGFTYIIKGRLNQNGFSIGCQNELTFETAAERADTFGLTGILSVFFLIAGMIMLFANEKPKWYPLLGVVGLIIAWILGILAFGWVSISSLVAFVIIIIIIGRHGKKQ